MSTETVVMFSFNWQWDEQNETSNK